MLTETLYQALISLGPGAVLAAVIFYFYRQDHQRLLFLAEDFKTIVQDNTQALTRLSELVDRELSR